MEVCKKRNETDLLINKSTQVKERSVQWETPPPVLIFKSYRGSCLLRGGAQLPLSFPLIRTQILPSQSTVMRGLVAQQRGIGLPGATRAPTECRAWLCSHPQSGRASISLGRAEGSCAYLCPQSKLVHAVLLFEIRTVPGCEPHPGRTCTHALEEG